MDNVHWFLKEYPQFELDDITENLCKELRSDAIEKGCIQFFPEFTIVTDSLLQD